MTSPPASPLRTIAFTLAVLAIWHGLAMAAPPEYIANEQIAPDSASELLTPFDGFVPEETEPVGPGILQDSISSYFPILSSFMNGLVLDLAPRTYYLYSSRDGVIREEAAYGGEVTLTTGWWEDFLRAGFSTATSQALYTPDGRGETGLLHSDGQGYWAPGEAYLEGKFGDLLTVKGFRQELNLPYFNRNDIRMTPRVHQAYTITSQTSANTSFGFAHISKMKERTSEEFRPLSDLAGASGTDRGATLAGARYRWRDGDSNIGALNAYGWDTFNTLYAESAHRYDLPNDFELNASAQFTHQGSVGEEFLGNFNTWSVGAQTALSYAGFIATLAYTKVDDAANIRNPWGGSPLFNSVMISDFDRAGEDALRISLSYPFKNIGIEGVSAFASYVNGDTPNYGAEASADQEEFNVNLDFRPQEGRFTDFWLRFRYGTNDGLANVYHETFRVILNYSLKF